MAYPVDIGGGGSSTSDLVSQLLQSGALRSYSAGPTSQAMGALPQGFQPMAALPAGPGASPYAMGPVPGSGSAIPMGGFGSTGAAPPPGAGNYSMVPQPQALGAGPAGGYPTFGPTSAPGMGAYDEAALRLGGGGEGAIADLAAQGAGALGGGAEGAAGFLGRLGGSVGSKLGFLAPGAEEAGIGATLAGLKGLIPGGIAGAGISAAGHVVGSAIGGKPGQVVSDASTGAGLGMMLGPEGALVGGALGGLYGLFKNGKGAPDFNKQLDTYGAQGGIDPQSLNQMKLTYAVLKQTVGDKAARQQVSTMLLQNMQSGTAAADNQSKLLATQALTAQFFQPFTQQMLQSAQMRHQAVQNMLPSLPPEYRGIALGQDAANLDNATRTANAYAAQAQLIPATATLAAQQAGTNQAAQSAYSQAISGGGGTGISQLVAQAQGTPAG